MVEPNHFDAETVNLRQRCAALADAPEQLDEILRAAGEELVWRPTPCQADDICENSLQAVKGLASGKHLAIAFVADPAGIELVADAHWLERMLTSLLTHAAHAAPQDTRLMLRITGMAPQHQVTFEVLAPATHGAQLDVESNQLAPTLTDSSDAGRAMQAPLPMLLIHCLAELHAGTAGIHTADGSEVVYWLTLPWQPLAAPSTLTPAARPTVEPTGTPGNHVLLVEDNEVNAEIVSDFLIGNGLEVTIAGDGLAAVEKVQRTAPDLILMDIHLPGIDGIEAIRRIRRDPDQRIATIPIIALTALAMASDRERCLAAGASNYLSKPVSLRELLGVIRHYLPPSSPSGSPAAGDAHV